MYDCLKTIDYKLLQTLPGIQVELKYNDGETDDVDDDSDDDDDDDDDDGRAWGLSCYSQCMNIFHWW